MIKKMLAAVRLLLWAPLAVVYQVCKGAREQFLADREDRLEREMIKRAMQSDLK